MKKLSFTFGILLITVFDFFAAGIISYSPANIIITHPTVSNIKNFQYLIDHDILPDIKITGVFYKYEQYDYALSEQYITENHLDNFQLTEISDTLLPGQLRQHNACSDDFYRLTKKTQGIIFLGGDDLPPAAYGNQTNLLTNLEDPQRHYFELSFMYHLLGNFNNEQDSFPILKNNPNYIVWGICLGMQTMNVALGGTLIQDIPSKLYKCKTVEDVLALDSNSVHKNYERNLHPDFPMVGGKFHPISFTGKSFLKTIAKRTKNTTPIVYSYHHQCVKKLSTDFTIIATSLDGKIPEAIHHNIYPNVYGFQFHFEYQYLYNPSFKVFMHITDKGQQSLLTYLEQNNSLNFQYGIWEYFARLILT